MAQQWRDVLVAQIIEHIYVDEDWFSNRLVQENANIAIAKQKHPIHGGSKPSQFPNLPGDQQLRHDRIYVDYFFENHVYMMGDYLEGA